MSAPLAPFVRHALLDLAEKRGLPFEVHAKHLLVHMRRLARRDDDPLPGHPSIEAVQRVGLRHMKANPRGDEIDSCTWWTYSGGRFLLFRRVPS